MGLSVGIVGLPNVGKSTIFNALTAAGAQSANYPFCTIEPNVGIVPVVDPRLMKIAELAESKQTVFTDLKVVDIAGLVRGASKGEGLGNQFLANIRETDAILHVVRCFEDPNVMHVEGSVDPERDIEVIETELLLADLDALSKRNDRVGRLARVGQKEYVAQAEALTKAIAAVEKGTPLRAADLSDSDRDALAAQISQLPEGDRGEFLKDMGLEEPGLNVLIRAAYKLLDLETFFTAGPKEARAWTLHRGAKAPQAAGEIHSDF